MGPATAAPDIFQVVITLISICFQVSAAVSFQESFDMVFCPGLRISEKDDRREAVFSGSYQPHTGLRLCAPLRFFQHLDPCLIRHQEAPLQEFPVEESVYMDKVPVHTVYDPVRYRRPGKLHPELEPVLFLPVQGQRKAIFLIDAPCGH